MRPQTFSDIDKIVGFQHEDAKGYSLRRKYAILKADDGLPYIFAAVLDRTRFIQLSVEREKLTGRRIKLNGYMVDSIFKRYVDNASASNLLQETMRYENLKQSFRVIYASDNTIRVIPDSSFNKSKNLFAELEKFFERAGFKVSPFNDVIKPLERPEMLLEFAFLGNDNENGLPAKRDITRFVKKYGDIVLPSTFSDEQMRPKYIRGKKYHLEKLSSVDDFIAEVETLRMALMLYEGIKCYRSDKGHKLVDAMRFSASTVNWKRLQLDKLLCKESSPERTESFLNYLSFLEQALNDEEKDVYVKVDKDTDRTPSVILRSSLLLPNNNDMINLLRHAESLLETVVSLKTNYIHTPQGEFLYKPIPISIITRFHKKFEQVLRYHTPLQALWLLFFLYITQSIVIERRCVVCGEVIPASSRADKLTCSPGCRNAARNEQKSKTIQLFKREGKSITEIAKTVRRSEEWVEKCVSEEIQRLLKGFKGDIDAILPKIHKNNRKTACSMLSNIKAKERSQ